MNKLPLAFQFYQLANNSSKPTKSDYGTSICKRLSALVSGKTEVYVPLLQSFFKYVILIGQLW